MEIKIFDETVSYFIEDTGKPKVLFIHGLGSRKESFTDPIKTIERSFDIVALDMVCHGHTSCTTPSISHMFKITKEFVKLMKLENIIVVGYSMGGAVALSLLELPQVKEAVLLSPINYAINFKLDALEAVLPTGFIKAIMAAKSLIASKKIEGNAIQMKDNFLKTFKQHHSELHKIVTKEICNKEFQMEVLKPLYFNNNNYQLIGGTSDLFVPMYSLKDVVKDTGVKLQEIKNVGHIPAHETNLLIVKTLNELIDVQ